MRYCCTAITTIRAPGDTARPITNIVRLAGVVTVFVLGGALILLFRKEKHDQGIGTGRA